MKLKPKQVASGGWSQNKSLSNLFKIAAIVAFIKYELINQQQVSGRARGLIYNRDGKFIYKPPKSDQGHIIVIDDRHRDEPKATSAAQQAAYPLAPPPNLSAESAYHPIQIIQPRLYHPGAQLSGAAYARAGLYTPGGRIHLINLNDYRSVATAAGGGQLYPAGVNLATDARLGPQATLDHAVQSTNALQVMPLIPVYQTQRVNPYKYIHAPQTIELENDHNQALIDNQYAAQEARARSFRHGVTTREQRMFEADTPIGVYEHPLSPPPPSPHASEAFLDDTPAPNEPMISRQASDAKPSREFEQMELDMRRPEFHDEAGHLRMAGSPPVSASFKSASVSKPLEAASMQEVAPPAELVGPNFNRPPRLMPGELPRKMVGGPKNSYIRSRSNAKSRRFAETNPTKPDEMDPNNNDPRSIHYWKQFKDQFDIVQ